MSFYKEDLPRRTGLGIPDFVAVAMILSAFAAIVTVGSYWFDPLEANGPLNASLQSLPLASFLSVSRIILAYIVSLIFSIGIGYWAAHSKMAEKILIPLIDILQSIPVLGFLPGFVLLLLSVFPSSRIGLELSAILMIFTGMAWNMTLGFYASIKSMPADFKDVIKVSGYGPLGSLLRLELPFATKSLAWNSMLSVAGGWFFLTTCEAFKLGDNSFQLVGLGSYMSVANENGDYYAILAGFLVMVGMLVLIDLIIWKPLLNWTERFQRNLEQEDSDELTQVMDFFSDSHFISSLMRRLRRRYSRLFSISRFSKQTKGPSPFWRWFSYLIALLSLIVCLFGSFHFVIAIYGLPLTEWLVLGHAAAWSFFRVFCVLVLCCLTMLPLGLMIASRPGLVKKLQTIIQVLASFPAPMLFPIIITAILWLNIPMTFGSIFLMMMGAQWYLLFNVLSGATNVPPELVEVAQVKGFNYFQILYRVYLPASFPQIVTGLLTAAGGAWNTSIVAELVFFHGKQYDSPGLGSYIAKSATNEQYAQLVAAVALMVVLIVLVNRFVWARLYDLAQSRFQMDG